MKNWKFWLVVVVWLVTGVVASALGELGAGGGHGEEEGGGHEAAVVQGVFEV